MDDIHPPLLRTPWGDLTTAQQRLSMAEQHEILRGRVSRRRFLKVTLRR